MIVSPGGLLEGAEQHPSPNRDERPEEAPVDLLVIHNISLPPNEFGGPWIDNLFQNCLDPGAHPYFRDICNLQVSTHVLIRRQGEVIQYVPFDQRAWHAGLSQFEGRERCNDFSIGIELEGADDTPYTDLQYERLAEVAHAVMEHYPDITPQRIVGHRDISPGRKTDPGEAFDWQRFQQLLAEGV
ncbi:1,6-anhydro-N-acetylmuramyl-L-alanine amidase AmpD [Solemya velesiana gill symbiont]|uniref:1,6-anhydro-N-acetylmuramyl-L-alanine amidase AmpD n=1 Tax=Solemya velesiana gill symbiont TaxID=1918948 RepID=A0A1T2KVD5_9GAMM|nr:1,6-anhydro-N-acetylmuramyl-L-alanine amidase AmpD [Solemya velesiana gill symbiont]OOZ36761.1 N-acetylmuramoyl-L-alanine amidase [Solemya velesiana gill symbiont]